MTEVSISRYCTGDRIPHPILLAKLIPFLGCDTDWLIGTKGKADFHSAGNWIPVKDRLPKDYSYVYATCKADGRENWVIDTCCYVPLSKLAPNSNRCYSDWGNVPILNSGQAEVIAWMPHDIPEPYQEAEDE